jgi:hypothetical protein
MVLAALSFAHAEVLWLLQHQGQQPPKSRSKYHDASHFEDDELALLIGLVAELVTITASHRRVVRCYYVAYLKGAHRANLEPLLAAAAEPLGTLGPVTQRILPTLLGRIEKLTLDGAEADGAAATTTDADAGASNAVAGGGDGSEAEAEAEQMRAFRIDWARCANALAMSSRMGAITQVGDIVTLALRMHAVCEQSKYVDSIDALLDEAADLSACWWFEEHMLAVFDGAIDVTVAARDGVLTEHAVAFVYTLARSAARVSPLCPEEHALVAADTQRCANALLERLCAQVRALLSIICRHVEQLEQQVAPIEAAYRQVRRLMH